MTAHVARSRGTFLEEVIEATPGGERLVHCLQCGSCGGSCPSGADMQCTPRTLFALINAGQRESGALGQYDVGLRLLLLLHHPLPAKHPHHRPHVHAEADVDCRADVRQHRRPGVAKTFTDFVDKYGRSFEFGLATSYHLLNRPLRMMQMGQMGLQCSRAAAWPSCPPRSARSASSGHHPKAKELGGASEIRLLSRMFAGVQRRGLRPSVREVADLLGIKLQELDDWNCCGATDTSARTS